MQLIPIEKYFLTETLFVRPEGLFSAFLIEHPRRNILIVAFHYVIFLFLFHHMLIFTSLCQLVIRISGNKNMLHKNTSSVKFSLYRKKAGLASRNIVHIQINVGSVSTSIFFILYVKPTGLLQQTITWYKTCDLNKGQSSLTGCILRSLSFNVPVRE